MFKSKYRMIAVILPLVLVGLIALVPGASAKKKKKQTVTTETYVFQPPTLQLTAAPTVITACAGETARVQLDARATFTSGSPRYRWSASGGRIEGNGANTTWDLSGLQPGYYKAYVDVDNGTTEACAAFTSATVLVKCAPPVCPSILISCPDKINPNQPVTFSATVAGGSPGAHVYNWTVTAGKIISGEGTSTITVDTNGLAGQSVRATLTMGGYNTLNCTATCIVQIPPELPVCRKFDEFPAIARDDEKARLDNYAIELQNDPTATAYVIVYPGQSGKPGEVQAHITRAVDYLANSRGIDKRRIITIIGPTRGDLAVELWVCPQGAKTPIPGSGI